jgi:cobalamin biosynthesis protein CobT
MQSRPLENALEKVSRVITDRHGLRLVCEGEGCRTDGKTIFLPSLPDDVSEDLLSAIRGWADHECAHAIFTETDLSKEFIQQHGKAAFGILNALEDARVERLISKRYPGSSINLTSAFRFVVEKARAGQVRQLTPLEAFTSALYTRAGGEEDQDWMPADAYALADACADEVDASRSCRTTRQVAEVAERIWEKVKECFPVLPSSSGGSGPGEGAESPLAQQEQQGGGKPSEPSDRKDPPTTQASRQQPPQGNGTTGAFSPMDALGELIRSEATQFRQAKDAYSVWSTEYDVVEVPEIDPAYNYRAELAELRPYVAGLRMRLLQTLLGRRESLWLGDQPKGRLNPRALHRLATGRDSRIFRRRVVSDGGATACTLLLDLSSSMRGDPLKLCKQLGLLFAETLELLRFPTEVIGFSTLDTDVRAEVAARIGMPEEELSRRFNRFVPLYHAVFKGFNEPWRQVAGRLGKADVKALTPLGESLLFAGRRLSLRPERRKVLFCLTDGKPVAGCYDEAVTLAHACQSVKRLAEAGIEPVGIGICEPLVADIFPRHAIIKNLSELPSSFLKELCSVLAGG